MKLGIDLSERTLSRLLRRRHHPSGQTWHTPHQPRDGAAHQPNSSDEDDERRRYYRLTKFGSEVARAEAERLKALVNAARQRKLLP